MFIAAATTTHNFLSSVGASRHGRAAPPIHAAPTELVGHRSSISINMSPLTGLASCAADMSPLMGLAVCGADGAPRRPCPLAILDGGAGGVQKGLGGLQGLAGRRTRCGR